MAGPRRSLVGSLKGDKTMQSMAMAMQSQTRDEPVTLTLVKPS